MQLWLAGLIVLAVASMSCTTTVDNKAFRGSSETTEHIPHGPARGALAQPPVSRAGPLVYVSLSENEAHQQAFLTAFKAALAEAPIALDVGITPAPAPVEAAIVVPVGVRACQNTLAAPISALVVCTLVPQLTIEPLITAAAGRATALYLDQPFRRQLALIQRAFPQKRHLGVVFGPTSASLEPQVRAAAREQGLELHSVQFTPGDRISGVLDDLLKHVDVMLAVPDPAVHTKAHIHTLLLAPYRHEIPVVGYSASYVTAGAALGLFTTPEQSAQQTAQRVQALLNQASPVPPPQPSRYFTVQLNKPVARSLRLSLPEAQDLHAELLHLE